MPRVIAGIILLALIWGCASIPGLKEESVATYIRVPFVRVLLEDGRDSIKVSADNAFAIECLEGAKQTVYYSGQPVEVTNDDLALKVINSNGDIIQGGLTEVNIIPRGSNNRLKVNDKRYRGIMKVVPTGRNVRLVNILYMEDYLKGVVPPEIGDRTFDELEAVKAQAVAARTYAMSHLQQYGAEPYDVKSSIIDQLYGGVDIEDRLVNQAVEATAGEVITYQDEMIDAYYHSTCGGMTDDIVDVWDRAEVPYLKPVHDTACSWSKYYKWEETFTEPQLRGRIEQYLSQDRGREIKISPITNVVVGQRTAGGRVMTLEIRTADDSYRFYKDRIRWVIGRTSNPDLILPSSNFDVDIRQDSQGYIEKIVFFGSGYGHGVGMCQCGAIGHAREGWKYPRILETYYTGIEIKKLY
jgi:stage II sporulation protein D